MNNHAREVIELQCWRCLSWTGQSWGGFYSWQQILPGTGLDAQVGKSKGGFELLDQPLLTEDVSAASGTPVRFKSGADFQVSSAGGGDE